jgi:hypothetical protein
MRLHPLVLLLAASLVLPSVVFADESYTFIVKKQDEKTQAKKGWNLADWISQRDSMRTRDLWLAMHTPTPYEFYLSGDYRFLDSPKDERDHRFKLAAFARIVGLSLESESNPNRVNAFLNLRVFGLYQQGTNITLYGGLRSQTEPNTLRSGTYGVMTTLYLTRLAGFEFDFRKYLDATSEATGAGQGGSMIEANLFIDFRFLRIYGGHLKTTVDPQRESGYQLGARFFF